MGEIAELMVSGALCAWCGSWTEEYLENGEGPGYESLCEDCKNEEEAR